MKQLYKVSGDFELMLHWDRYFGNEEFDGQKEENAKKQNKDNRKQPVMMTMLLAWISFWVAMSVNAEVGPYIALVVGASLPLIMRKYALIFYDRLSIALIALISVFALVTNQTLLALVFSYLGFGLMWFLSCFTKEPVCAAYVKYDYSGEDALQNPIFMKTNYIIAAGWGILYIVMAIWTYLFAETVFAENVLMLNNIMPAFMGVFTVWFQKWYPKKMILR